MDARKNRVHFLLIFGTLVTWNCLAESKTGQNDVESLYQAMSDRVSALEAGLLQHPAEIDKLRQEYRSEVDLLKKKYAEQVSGLTQEIVSLRLEKETQIQELKQEITTMRLEHESQIQEFKQETTTMHLEHESQIQELKQILLSPVMENVGVIVDEHENDNIPTVEMSESETNEAEYHHFVTNKSVPSSANIKGVQKSRIIKRQAETTDHVAFFAKLSADSLNMGSNQVIKFEDIVTNIGNAYDSSIGVFRAPRAGVYLFSTTITAYSTKSGHVGIFINDIAETSFYVNGAQNSWDETSQTIIVNLKQGDNVTVRTGEMGHGIAGASHSIFSGMLLFENDGQGSIVGSLSGPIDVGISNDKIKRQQEERH